MLSTSALSCAAKKAPSNQMGIAYAIFIALSFATYHMIAGGEFSAILTLAAMLQSLAFALLALQTLATGSSHGISARALALDALALALRLSSTLWLQGYLPVDASGDFLYQAVDLCSLALVLWLLRRVIFTCRGSYQEGEDSFPVIPTVIAAVLLAALLHADINSRPLFDTLWLAGLFVSVVAVLPQLWLVTRTGGKIEALTSHYIATMAFSRALSGTFMWHARFDITCDPWVEGFNHAIWAILGAHALHLLLLGDFGFYYLKAVAKSGLAAQLELAGLATCV